VRLDFNRLWGRVGHPLPAAQCARLCAAQAIAKTVLVSVSQVRASISLISSTTLTTYHPPFTHSNHPRIVPLPFPHIPTALVRNTHQRSSPQHGLDGSWWFATIYMQLYSINNPTRRQLNEENFFGRRKFSGYSSHTHLQADSIDTLFGKISSPVYNQRVAYQMGLGLPVKLAAATCPRGGGVGTSEVRERVLSYPAHWVVPCREVSLCFYVCRVGWMGNL